MAVRERQPATQDLPTTPERDRHFPALIIGGTMDSQQYDFMIPYNEAFINNVRAVLAHLGPTTHIVTAVYPQEEIPSDPPISFREWTEDKVRELFPLIQVHTITSLNHDDIGFPRNEFVVTEQGAFGKTGSPVQDFLKVNHNIPLSMDGGKFVGAEAGPVIFAAVDEWEDTERREQATQEITAELFPTRPVIALPDPHQMGKLLPGFPIDLRRVSTHIDQYIGQPLATHDPHTVLVPMDEKYLEGLQMLKALPTTTETGVHLWYRPVNHRYLGANYTLNTLTCPSTSTFPNGIIFIEPDLREALSEQGVWDMVDTRNVVILPSNIPVNDTKAGLGCKAVILP